jgi:hypothetical protein
VALLSNRSAFGGLIALTIPLGLASRADGLAMPGLVREFGGDVLSATCIFFGVAFCVTRWPVVRQGLLAFAICVLIELQQLIKWSWLVRLREDTPLDILLGHGFLWSDIASYAVGVILGVLVGSAVVRSSKTRNAPVGS